MTEKKCKYCDGTGQIKSEKSVGVCPVCKGKGKRKKFIFICSDCAEKREVEIQQAVMRRDCDICNDKNRKLYGVEEK